ncbi:phenylalanine--tRNA ligase subunit beta [Nitratifractor salsuginis]|uniref:Phenylalanine--tRNA ligase beta subunit n=1 Tax=Nitratifractor salsuginis (strain DSM 16511 / JCM 12458 / E9I37-1) TaxID=749222 RepID=E6WZU1_NITSE|nr:phenylalanine--tRNA ligase subunit beta [Nitratifractor salsuginis]ADV45599.1 phenylalanyl-tRNA synthetase, beta subunit [Nitratifractor salsuginis DSM 16511]
MIVTRRWLEEYIDLEGISDQALHDTFNSIGLEVDSMQRHTMPEKVVVGRILSCEKHPDADKLNLCSVDVGADAPLQIVCGAANVREAEYVAVATVGAVLPGDFAIKPAKLRGVESFGMICSSSELGLPEMGKGIIILDKSIGELVPGKPLRDYPDFNDTVIELELTANRGDCLSIRGVARDLSAALDRPLVAQPQPKPETLPLGIARIVDLHTHGQIEAELLYDYVEKEALRLPLLIELRLAYVDAWSESPLASHLAYATHATGVILRAYDAGRLRDGEGRVPLELEETAPGLVEVRSAGRLLSVVGVTASAEFTADDESRELLLEASYIDPERLVPAVAAAEVKPDALYYRSSRGSEPEIDLGMDRLMAECSRDGECRVSKTPLRIETDYEARTLAVDTARLNAVIGQEIPLGTVHTILKRLGFTIHGGDKERFGVTIPRWRHDIRNIQDIAEEILRIVGINNIEAKPLAFTEANRLTESAKRFRIRRDLRQEAVAAGFYEAVTYAFADRKKLEAYGFPVVEASKELLNPIVEEFNTLRSTLTINLLEAAQRNVSYGKRRIPLFEIGSVFDRERREREKMTLLWSGDAEEPDVGNQGKPPRIDFALFVRKLGSILGEYEMTECRESNGLIHPYQSATILLHGQEAGWVSKLHPSVAEAFGLEETFLAELDFDALIPPHIDAQPVSNFQGTFKDLSLLVEKELPYGKMKKALESLEEPLLKRFFPIDRYEDEQLGERKSMTLRFFLQSDEGTLSDEVIEGVMARILETLQSRCGAELR